MLVSFFEACATVSGSPAGAPALALFREPSNLSEGFRSPVGASGRRDASPESSLHSYSESLCPEIVRAGRRGELACPDSPARQTFGLPHAAAPAALGREGGNAQLIRDKARSSDVWTFVLACVVVCVCSRTGVGARAGAQPHQAFGRMEGVLERAWNHPALDKCLELVEDSTQRSRRGVTERCARGFLVLRLTECTKQ